MRASRPTASLLTLTFATGVLDLTLTTVQAGALLAKTSLALAVALAATVALVAIPTVLDPDR